MAKYKSVFICRECGYQTARWLGRCPECGSWETMEEHTQDTGKQKVSAVIPENKPVPLNAQVEQQESRIPSGLSELDRVLGGGIVSGSLVLIGGDPGIGKSTLMLQMLAATNTARHKLYISGEESFGQIRQRARRLSVEGDNVLFINETNLELIVAQIQSQKPEFAVIDSIQTVSSAVLDGIPGNSSQLRYCTNELVQLAKREDIPIFLVGHVTKDGAIAGPKILEHLVDTVLYFEDESKGDFRILRCIKNRFGSVNEIALFRMEREGLIPVKNASELFLNDYPGAQQGTTVTAVMEGNRPILVEVQALVSRTQFGTPQRTATGIGHRRMNLLLAVLEKKCGKPFGFHDVFLKTAAGLRLDEPAADLAICMALVSSMDETEISTKTAYIGEVGLNGELRPVSYIQERIFEAEKLGFEKIIIPASPKSYKSKNAKIMTFRQIQELV